MKDKAGRVVAVHQAVVTEKGPIDNLSRVELHQIARRNLLSLARRSAEATKIAAVLPGEGREPDQLGATVFTGDCNPDGGPLLGDAILIQDCGEETIQIGSRCSLRGRGARDIDPCICD